jgi:hypothetical protein
MKQKLTGRQGDVGFIAGVIPADAKSIKIRPFALGEATGHSHRVAVEDEVGIEMFETLDETGTRTFMRVTKDGGISILHEDHDPTGVISKLPQGWEGEVVIAKEYDEENDFRRVID